jgi:cytidyltransferase-like protein
LEKIRSESKTVVFTNGVFDILHRGHAEYLKKSKDIGDILIVGVNDDDSVGRLKGKDQDEVSRCDYIVESEITS